MSLKNRITDDMKAAMKGGEKERLGTIRLILAALKQREVDERIVLDDSQITSVLEKMLKQRKDSIEQFSAAGRKDRSAERNEIAVIEAYLPAPLDPADIGRSSPAPSPNPAPAAEGHGQGHRPRASAGRRPRQLGAISNWSSAASPAGPGAHGRPVPRPPAVSSVVGSAIHGNPHDPHHPAASLAVAAAAPARPPRSCARPHPPVACRRGSAVHDRPRARPQRLRRRQCRRIGIDAAQGTISPSTQVLFIRPLGAAGRVLARR